MKTALISGTFDPITLGHVDVITRASGMFDRVIVAVMNNLNKQSRFTLAERKRMAEAVCRELPHVEVAASDGMMVEFFDRIGADVIVRGVRDPKDFVYETEMADYLRRHNPRIDTVFLHADERLCAVSSTEVRRLLDEGKDVSEYVPKIILGFLH